MLTVELPYVSDINCQAALWRVRVEGYTLGGEWAPYLQKLTFSLVADK